MKVSYNWLQTFFDAPLPTAPELEKLLTFHSSEIDELFEVGSDTVFDVKVLPDKSAWLLSHRGIAKEISVITGMPLALDLFKEPAPLGSITDRISIELTSAACDFYSAALVTGVAVLPSPAWLVERLSAIGQRSINNIVDATNYVMFELGQPLHAFDAAKLGDVSSRYHIGVRAARPGETIVTLTGESYALSDTDAIIVDTTTDSPIGIAGIKGGKIAAVDTHTTDLLIEAAHFDRVMIRNTTKRLKLVTDASKRYENGISKGVAPIALQSVVTLILAIAGGELVGYQSIGDASISRPSVTVTLDRIRSVLGLPLSLEDVTAVLARFGYAHSVTGTSVTITPPFERDDIIIAEDVIEELGRMYGLEHITAIAPVRETVTAINVRHYYAEVVRATLAALGFSEIFTSSFRNQDSVRIKNALASDKSYLRSRLHENLKEAVVKNIPHRDLLGLSAIKVFEIGSVFTPDTESVHVGIGVQTGTTYKAKADDPLILEAQAALASALLVPLSWQMTEDGVTEFSLDEVLTRLKKPEGYVVVDTPPAIVYQPFSLYPSVSRDVAVWVPVTILANEVETVLRTAASGLCVRVTLFDTFIKDDRTSLAFRLVFQSKEKTLDGSEVDALMSAVYAAATKVGWETR